MTDGHPEIDVHHSDIARFYPHQMRREHTRLRTTEAFIKTYGIVHPAEQYESDRDQRLSPMHESEAKLGARFFEAVGWERPQWYESNADLLEVYGDRVMPRENEWDARWWSPIVNAEHLRMRDAAGVIDLTAFAIFDITGPGALDAVQRTCVSQCDVAVGKVIYTPVLDAKGGFRSDLTVMRLGDDHFRVVTGGAHGMADRKWFADQLPDGRIGPPDRPHRRGVHDRAVGTAGARHPLVAHRRRRSAEGFGFLTCREIDRRRHPGARVADLLRRRARLGALRLDGGRRRAVGQGARGGCPARCSPGRHRGLRDDRTDREGLPRVRLRARRRAQHRRGRHAAAQGQGRGLRRQGRLPRAAGHRAGVRPVHAHRRGPHVGLRGAALHARW